MTGSAWSKQAAASSGSATIRTGPPQTAAIASGEPTPKKGARPASRRAVQALAKISGPIPAGSPRETASGDATGRSAIVDDGVAAKVAQVTQRPHVDPLLGQLARHLIVGDVVDRRRIVAAAQDEDADPFGRAERRGRLADGEAEQHLLERRGKIANLDLVADHLGAETAGGRFGAAASAHALAGLAELLRFRLDVGA